MKPRNQHGEIQHKTLELMPLIGILFALVILILLVKAMFETLYGTCLILVGLLVGAFGYTLKTAVWTGRNLANLWTTAFCD